MSDEKKVLITGTSNRYQINKLKKEEPKIKLRQIKTKSGLPDELYLSENQEQIINELYNKTDLSETANYKIIKQQLENKLGSYKQQDLLKKRYDELSFIAFNDTIKKLYESKLCCHYCQSNLFIMYDIVREMSQWTLDRINNDIGHNTDNVVISCLDCNLKRRRTGKDAFLFTKQLNIVKI